MHSGMQPFLATTQVTIFIRGKSSSEEGMHQNKYMLTVEISVSSAIHALLQVNIRSLGRTLEYGPVNHTDHQLSFMCVVVSVGEVGFFESPLATLSVKGKLKFGDGGGGGGLDWNGWKKFNCSYWDLNFGLYAKQKALCGTGLSS